jgi:hypothetical protein
MGTFPLMVGRALVTDGSVRLDERPAAETAVFLCRSEQEVREKIAELEHGASTVLITTSGKYA